MHILDQCAASNVPDLRTELRKADRARKIDLLKAKYTGDDLAAAEAKLADIDQLANPKLEEFLFEVRAVVHFSCAGTLVDRFIHRVFW